MWNISAFFSCHFAFISCACTVQRVSVRPFMRFGTTSTMQNISHVWHDCFVLTAVTTHHQQHYTQHTVLHIPLGVREQNRFICIILSVNAFSEWMQLILRGALFGHLMIQQPVAWLFFFFLFYSFSIKWGINSLEMKRKLNSNKFILFSTPNLLLVFEHSKTSDGKHHRATISTSGRTTIWDRVRKYWLSAKRHHNLVQRQATAATN